MRATWERPYPVTPVLPNESLYLASLVNACTTLGASKTTFDLDLEDPHHSMEFEHVGLQSIGYLLPPEVISSNEIESRLRPVYERLRLPEGRLELMSGIRERRLWHPRTRLSDTSARSCQLALEAAQVPPEKIGCLMHASVCREYLEPATACRVHHLCRLPKNCWVYDVSNACLGLLNGVIQIGTLIESGQIEAGIVVGSEDSRGLLEATLHQLLNDATLTRQSIKPAFASLTIGSGSCALLVVDRRKYPDASPIHCGVVTANTAFHGLCESDQDQAGGNMQPLMNTDSEQLLHAGIATGVETFSKLLAESRWNRDSIDRTVCHQVGVAHRKLMLESLGLSTEKDHAVFPILGNTGSVALPTALGLALSSGFIQPGHRTGLLGIGSGINSLMLAMTMQNTASRCEDLSIGS